MNRRSTLSKPTRRSTIPAAIGRLAQTFGLFAPKLKTHEDQQTWSRLETIHRLSNDVKELELRLDHNSSRAATQCVAIETQITALNLGGSFHPKFLDDHLAELGRRVEDLRDLARVGCGKNSYCSHVIAEPIIENPLVFGASSVLSSRPILAYLMSHWVAAILGNSEADIVRRAYRGVDERLRRAMKEPSTFDGFLRSWVKCASSAEFQEAVSEILDEVLKNARMGKENEAGHLRNN